MVFCCRIFTTLKLLKENQSDNFYVKLKDELSSSSSSSSRSTFKKIKLRKHLNTHGSLNILPTNDSWMFQRVVTCII